MEKTIDGYSFKGKSDSINIYKDGKLIKSKVMNGILFQEDFDRITEKLAKELSASEM